MEVLALIVAFGPVSVLALKSLHEIEHQVRCIRRQGAEGHAYLGTEERDSRADDDPGNGDTR